MSCINIMRLLDIYFYISESDVVTGIKLGLYIYVSRYDRHGSMLRAGKLPSAKV